MQTPSDDTVAQVLDWHWLVLGGGAFSVQVIRPRSQNVSWEARQPRGVDLEVGFELHSAVLGSAVLGYRCHLKDHLLARASS